MVGEEIFHYTDLESLIGIVTKQKLWATDAQFLNDSEELRHAQAACCSYMEGRIQEHRDNDENLVAALIELLVQKLRSIDEHDFPYVLSFTSEGDQLSQWRGYGKFGQGVSVGFVFDVNNWRMVNRSGVGVIDRLYRRLYRENEQNLLFRAIMDAQLKVLAKQKAKEWTERLDQWANWLVSPLIRTFPYIKSPAFMEEHLMRFRVCFQRLRQPPWSQA